MHSLERLQHAVVAARAVRPVLHVGAVALLALTAACADTLPAPHATPDERAAASIDSVPVLIAVTDGVAGTRPGVHWVRRGGRFAYRFAPAGPFATAEVRVDGVRGEARGELTVDAPRYVLVAAWPDTAGALDGEAGRILARMARAADPLPPLRELAALSARAGAAGDSARVREIVRARYAMSRRLGPDGYAALTERVRRAQFRARRDAAERAAAERAAGERAAGDRAAPARVGGAPLSVVYVNGVLNSPSTSAESRDVLGAIVDEAGLRSNADGTAREVTMPEFHNPRVTFANTTVAQCARDLLWLLATLEGLDGTAAAFATRLAAVATQPEFAECFRSNLRAVIDYLVQVAGGTASLNQDDIVLRDLVEDARSRGGNVLLVAHSQGAMIARKVAAQLRPRTLGGALGCVGVINIGSPVGPDGVPRVEFETSVIAKGEAPGVYDLLWHLPGPRTDGRSSAKTAEVDRTSAAFAPFLPDFVLDLVFLGYQIDLHGAVTTYFDRRGYRDAVRDWLREAAGALDAACGEEGAAPGGGPAATAQRVHCDERPASGHHRIVASPSAGALAQLGAGVEIELLISATLSGAGMRPYVDNVSLAVNRAERPPRGERAFRALSMSETAQSRVTYFRGADGLTVRVTGLQAQQYWYNIGSYHHVGTAEVTLTDGSSVGQPDRYRIRFDGTGMNRPLGRNDAPPPPPLGGVVLEGTLEHTGTSPNPHGNIRCSLR